jgi:hypothetical protein
MTSHHLTSHYGSCFSRDVERVADTILCHIRVQCILLSLCRNHIILCRKIAFFETIEAYQAVDEPTKRGLVMAVIKGYTRECTDEEAAGLLGKTMDDVLPWDSEFGFGVRGSAFRGSWIEFEFRFRVEGRQSSLKLDTRHSQFSLPCVPRTKTLTLQPLSLPLARHQQPEAIANPR